VTEGVEVGKTSGVSKGEGGPLPALAPLFIDDLPLL
jgi:hypothetical protein